MSGRLTQMLLEYGDKSAQGLGRMRDAIADASYNAPAPVAKAADLAASLAPMRGTYDAGRLASEAHELWKHGQYDEALDRWGDSVLKARDDLFWFIPGQGLVRAAK